MILAVRYGCAMGEQQQLTYDDTTLAGFLFDASREAICIVKNGYIERCSRSALELLRASAEQLNGRHIDDAALAMGESGPAEGVQCLRFMEEALADGDAGFELAWRVDPGGTPVHTAVAARRHESGADRFLYLLLRRPPCREGMAWDFSENLTVYRAIYHQALHLAGILDIDGILLDVNAVARRFAGRDLQGFIGKPFWETPWWIHSAEEQQRLRGAVRRAAAGEEVRFETNHRDAAGVMHDIDFSLKPIRDASGRILCLVPEGRDVTERKRIEAALIEQERQFRALAENSYDTIMRFDRQCRHLYVNPNAEKETGIPAGEFIGKTHREMGFPPHLCKLWEDAIGKVFKTGGCERIEFQLPGGLWIDWLVMPERRADGSAAAVITAARDISDMKRYEEELRVSEQTYREIFNGVNDIILVQEAGTGMIIDANTVAQEYFGYSPEEFRGLSIDAVSSGIPPYSMEDALTLLRRAAEQGPQLFEWLARRRDGSPTWLEVMLKKSVIGGRECILGVSRDINERKHFRDELEQSLRLKDLLLKEIHHRVNNNLQIILSLINLQGSSTDLLAVSDYTRDLQNRIQAMAFVHELLYGSGNLLHIDFHAYVAKLAEYLMVSYGRSSDQVRISTRADGIRLDLNTAVNCGFVMNEILSNSLKYAVRNGRGCEIAIELVREGGGLRLSISDNGPGLPDGVNPGAVRTLGMRLVQLLSRQLRGRASWRSDGGTRFELIFGEGPEGGAHDSIWMRAQ
ncbi:MAG: PAS domain S-box protein [Spirochaetes bacterium]|nr:PAS domain S-box protein [Spirochaetota bacterium]